MILWIDEIHFAPPQTPWNDDSPVNTNKQWFPMHSKWSERILSTRTIVAPQWAFLQALGIVRPVPDFHLERPKARKKHDMTFGVENSLAATKSATGRHERARGARSQEEAPGDHVIHSLFVCWLVSLLDCVLDCLCLCNYLLLGLALWRSLLWGVRPYSDCSA